MNSGKSKSRLKTREPYGKVTEVGQVPVALQEIKELSGTSLKMAQTFEDEARLNMINEIVSSIIAITSASPGCLSDLTEWPKCCGCDATLAFIWTEQKTDRKNPYCSDCDDKLIQDGELPNRKMAMMA